MAFIVIICGLALIYVYFGYLFVLRLLCLFRREEESSVSSLNVLPTIDVIIAAHNEVAVISQRIANVLSCDYPGHLLRVIVVSDRSTDGTDEIVESFGDSRVILVRSAGGIGKSDAQNEALHHAVADVILFTDAESEFSKELLREIVRPFSSPIVGVVGGKMVFTSLTETGVKQAQGYYWRYELKVRECESRLGILAKASGSCLAVRRSVVKPIPSDVGEDCVVPLDAAIQGYRVVYADTAVAYDKLDSTVSSEFRSRVRMTLRNWIGTWRRAELLNPFRHPGYAFGLWSHRILRWLSPLFLLIVTIGTLFLAFDSLLWGVCAILLALFYLAGALGWWSERQGLHVPFVHTIFSFLLANTGFMVGVAKALLRKKIVAYR